MKKEEKIFIVLLILVFILGSLTYAKSKGFFIPEQPKIKVVNGVVDLNSMTLEQKIAQMVVGLGIRYNLEAFKNLQLGGVHLYALGTEHVFRNTVLDFQAGMTIPFFITTDLEGCINPFASYKNFTPASDVNSLGQAFEKGFREGEYLNDLGINLNFAPVVDLQDQIWKCRSFPGNEQNIAEFANAYILGLQNQGVIATVKHYPGKTLVVKDPHKFVVAADIDAKDILPYRYLLDRKDVKAIMVSHVISSGAVDSEGVPAAVSSKIIDDIKNTFAGLIISDEIHMLGLKNFYHSLDEMYLAVFKAGNDVVLNFDNDPNELYRMIQVVKAAVDQGEISEEQIDASVIKILKAKGLRVKS